MATKRSTPKPKAKTKAAAKPRTTKTLAPKGAGQKPITFRPGGLHASLGVPSGQPIPPGKMQAALSGQYGPKAAAQARFAKNVLTGLQSGGARTKGASRGRSR